MLCYTEGTSLSSGDQHNQISNTSITYELGTVAYSCNLNTQGAEAAGSQTQSQLELQGKTDSKVQKKNELPYGTFPVVIINCPAKEYLLKFGLLLCITMLKYWPLRNGYHGNKRILMDTKWCYVTLLLNLELLAG